MARKGKKPEEPGAELTEPQIIAALRRRAGVMAFAAQDLGCSRQNIAQRIEKSKRLQEALAAVEDELMDAAESTVKKAVLAGDKKQANWILEHSKGGRRRGYGTRTDVGMPDDQIEAIVASLGGDPEKFRAALLAFGVDPTANPGSPRRPSS